MTTVSTNDQDDNGTRNAHSVFLDYLKTAPEFLGALAAVLVALTGLLALILR
ncbi:hypothetical protein ACGFIP_13925 [Micromonospora zamorensis]|uniref:hypothetical protein n=1 Tax=Micromonospora zamorensis TaxID=709883 RepID=UPI003724B73C